MNKYMPLLLCVSWIIFSSLVLYISTQCTHQNEQIFNAMNSKTIKSDAD